MQCTCARNCVAELCSSPACNPIELIVHVATCRRLDEGLVERGAEEVSHRRETGRVRGKGSSSLNRRGSTVIRSWVEKGGLAGESGSRQQGRERMSETLVSRDADQGWTGDLHGVRRTHPRHIGGFHWIVFFTRPVLGLLSLQ